MTREEWNKIAAYLVAAWPHAEPTDETLDAWFDAVEDLDPQDALTAARAIQRDGREFPPTGGMIRQKAIELATPAADWSRGYELAMTNPCSYAYNAAEALDWLQARDPVAARAVSRYGVASWAMGSDMPEASRAQFRQIYELAAREARDGLAYAGLPAVEGPEPRKLGEVARRALTGPIKEQ